MYLLRLNSHNLNEEPRTSGPDRKPICSLFEPTVIGLDHANQGGRSPGCGWSKRSQGKRCMVARGAIQRKPPATILLECTDLPSALALVTKAMRAFEVQGGLKTVEDYAKCCV